MKKSAVEDNIGHYVFYTPVLHTDIADLMGTRYFDCLLKQFSLHPGALRLHSTKLTQKGAY
jgi:hypothetical protein